MAAALTFDPATHSYRTDCEEVPGVTQVLSAVGLIDFSWQSDKLVRGRMAHQAIELDIAGELDEDAAREVGVMPFVEAAREVRRVLGIESPAAVERALYHSILQYAGTIDLVANDVVLDWKTGEAQPWVRFQLAAYAALAEANGLIPVHAPVARRICAELHEDGGYRLFVLDAATWLEDFETFLAALRVYREKQHPRRLL